MEGKFIVITRDGETILSTWNDEDFAKEDAKEMSKTFGTVLVCKVIMEVK